ncbi:MAG: hypothetical protein ACE1ZS_06855, partial [Candidatus Poribacteria bacterium]
MRQVPKHTYQKGSARSRLSASDEKDAAGCTGPSVARRARLVFTDAEGHCDFRRSQDGGPCQKDKTWIGNALIATSNLAS